MTISGQGNITFEIVEKLLFQQELVEISVDDLQKVKSNFDFLSTFSKNKIIYGITTGFGPMAQYDVAATKGIDLQYNLIRSHCAGLGQELSVENVRAILIARLNTLLLAKSGVHPDLINILVLFINNKIYPVIKEHGSVGASGDLVQLAHVALALIGEGNVIYEGKIVPSQQVLNQLAIPPLKIYLREGIAIMNGTSAMTGIGIINLIYAQKLINWSIIISAMLNEIVESFDDHYSAELNNSKLHKGQRQVADQIRSILSGSKRIKNRSQQNYTHKKEDRVFQDKIQEYYSIRCVPQIIGPVVDTFENAKSVLINEINSINDNPIVDETSQNVFHGGNFHGDYVSLEMDKLKLAVTKLSMLMERQLNFLLNPKLNGSLPPFLNRGELGLQFGMQGMQFTATSTVAENQALSTSLYIHSIPNNNDNQDIVSMGANAALMTQKVIMNSFHVLAVEVIGIMEAIGYLKIEEKLSTQTKEIYTSLKRIMPDAINTSTPYIITEKVVEYCKNVDPLKK